MKADDPALVAAQYADEARLRARQSIYADSQGADPREVAFEAVAAARPARVLEVGGGTGELAARIASELGAAVVMVDQSPRMVELARGRGVDARLGDVEELAFADGSFDCAVAAWMLYHVHDLDRGLAELARVLAPRGPLVAVTNGREHLLELRALAGGVSWEHGFRSENATLVLGRHFATVERRDAAGWITIHDREAAVTYLRSLSDPPPTIAPFDVPLRVRRSSSVFVAEK